MGPRGTQMEGISHSHAENMAFQSFLGSLDSKLRASDSCSLAQRKTSASCAQNYAALGARDLGTPCRVDRYSTSRTRRLPCSSQTSLDSGESSVAMGNDRGTRVISRSGHSREAGTSQNTRSGLVSSIFSHGHHRSRRHHRLGAKHGGGVPGCSFRRPITVDFSRRHTPTGRIANHFQTRRGTVVSYAWPARTCFRSRFRALLASRICPAVRRHYSFASSSDSARLGRSGVFPAIAANVGG
jgi:hypothetical protein